MRGAPGNLGILGIPEDSAPPFPFFPFFLFLFSEPAAGEEPTEPGGEVRVWDFGSFGIVGILGIWDFGVGRFENWRN